MRFDKSWFEKHQAKLIRFSNSWIGRKFFDFAGGFGLGKIRVMALYPNAVSYDWKVKDGKLVKTTCFSTDNHYQKKLEHAYRFLMMFVPQAVAWKMLQPSGALLLPMVALTTISTFNPVAGTNSPCDGYVLNNPEGGATWATVRGAAAGTAINVTDLNQQMGGASWNGTNYLIWRGFLNFDTSTIDTDTITSATLSVAGTGNAAEDTNSSDIDIVSATPAGTNTLVVEDYDQVGSTVYVSLALASWDGTAGNYNDFVFPTPDDGKISKTTVTTLGQRNSRDTDNSAPTGANRCAGRAADAGVTVPKLVVEHAAASTGIPSGMLLMGIGNGA
jgi:hypothetical protein